MFDFFRMIGSYESRKVARYEKNGLLVSTCEVYDSEYPHETAVAHPDYNNGMAIVVESYDNKKNAEEGHLKWVEIMTSEKLPSVIESNGGIFGIN